jgi:hypothetical protein
MVLPEMGKRHFGIFSVRDNNRLPRPALRMIALIAVSSLLALHFMVAFVLHPQYRSDTAQAEWRHGAKD